ERADAGLLGLGGQLVEREITCRERGVHVEHRGQPLELRGARGGNTGEERHHDRGHTHLSQAHPRRRRARSLSCDSHRYDSAFSRASAKSSVETLEFTWSTAGSRPSSAARAGETPEMSDTTTAATRTFRRPTLGGAGLVVSAATVPATIAPSLVRAETTSPAPPRVG